MDVYGIRRAARAERRVDPTRKPRFFRKTWVKLASELIPAILNMTDLGCQSGRGHMSLLFLRFFARESTLSHNMPASQLQTSARLNGIQPSQTEAL